MSSHKSFDIPMWSEPREKAVEILDKTKFRKLSDVEPEKIKWLWDNRIPFGCVTLLEGDGGIGKSFIVASILASCTSGKPFPSSAQPLPPMNVMLLALEDDPAVVLRPRFENLGADCNRVFFLDESLQLSKENLLLVEKEIKAKGIKVLVIDPIIAYFAGLGDSNKSTDVRQFMNTLHSLAKTYQIAVICVRHWNKSSSAMASQKGSGSVDYRNASRSVLQVIKAENDRYLALEKSNYAAQAKTISFDIIEGKVVWGSETDKTADDILSMSRVNNVDDRSEVNEAEEFIKESLINGPMAAKEITNIATGIGISTATLRRARERLKVDTYRMHNKFWWKLPSQLAHVVQNSSTYTSEQVGQVEQIEISKVQNFNTRGLI